PPPPAPPRRSSDLAGVGARSSGGESSTTTRCPGGFRPLHLGLQALATAVEVAQLALQVRLEPRAVLPLELLELLDVLLQRRTLLVQAAHGLLVTLPGVALERVGLGARLAGDLLGLGTRVGEQLV